MRALLVCLSLIALFPPLAPETADILPTDGRTCAQHPATVAPLASSAAWTAEGDQMDAWFAFSISTAGDVNGDGYDDVIVGAFRYDNGQTDEGRAYLFYGSASGLSTSAGWTAEGDQANAWFGFSVSTAGDVNGDGYADVIVGAVWHDNGQTDEGRAYVYHGSSTGLTTGSANWIAEGNQADAQFGVSVSTAGDVNKDGYSDVVVGAYLYDNGQTNEGRAYVYHGSSTGLTTGPANWTAEGDQADAQFGRCVSTAGDVNGDGYADVIIGAYRYDVGPFDVGRAYVYHGSPSGLSASADWTTESDLPNARYAYSVSTAGDVNGDGYADVIVGAYGYASGRGRAFVYYGSPSGLSPSAGWMAESDQADANYAISVSTAGDVNGDGYADVIVGARWYDFGATDTGRAFVYHGSETGLLANPAWTANTNQVDAQLGYAVATADDVNGDGYGDVIVGAYSYDNGQTDEGRAWVYHGSPTGLATPPSGVGQWFRYE